MVGSTGGETRWSVPQLYLDAARYMRRDLEAVDTVCAKGHHHGIVKRCVVHDRMNHPELAALLWGDVGVDVDDVWRKKRPRRATSPDVEAARDANLIRLGITTGKGSPQFVIDDRNTIGRNGTTICLTSPSP